MTTKLIMILAVLTAMLVSCGDDITCPVCPAPGTDSGSSGITFRSDLKVVSPQEGDTLVYYDDTTYTILISYPDEFKYNLENMGVAVSIGIDATTGIRKIGWISSVYRSYPPENPAPVWQLGAYLETTVFFPVLTTNTADTIVGPEVMINWKSPPPAN